jgi:hypothetical protein
VAQIQAPCLRLRQQPQVRGAVCAGHGLRSSHLRQQVPCRSRVLEYDFNSVGYSKGVVGGICWNNN